MVERFGACRLTHELNSNIWPMTRSVMQGLFSRSSMDFMELPAVIPSVNSSTMTLIFCRVLLGFSSNGENWTLNSALKKLYHIRYGSSVTSMVRVLAVFIPDTTV